MTESTPSVGRDRVLAEALDAAHGVADAEERQSWIERVGRLAAMQGVKDVWSEALFDLPDPAGRANIHYHWASRCIAMGSHDEALIHLSRAREGVTSDPRWRPRCEWFSRELAIVDLADAYARMGLVDPIQTLVESTVEGGLARAAVRRSLVAALQRSGAKGIGVAWERAVKDALALASEDDRRRAVVELGRVVTRHGLTDRVDELLSRSREDQQWSEIQRRLLAIELGEALADAGEHSGARRFWAQVESWIVAAWGERPEPEDLQSGVDLLCRLSHRAMMIDQALAERFFLTAVQRTGQTPLPPDPNARYPWRTLFRSARQEPGLSAAMRELLRQKTVVPPGWCFALGIMELEAGRPDRAERAASALEKGHAFNPSDPEPLWLATLLWARTGQIERALDGMYPVLDELGDESLVSLPGQSGGAAHVELLFVDALVAGGALVRAAEMSRTVLAPTLRARLLTRAGWAYQLQEEPEQARALAVEALHALEELLAEEMEPGGGVLGPALELSELLWRSGDEEDAISMLESSMERLATGPGVLVIPVLCRHARRVQDLAPLFDRLLTASISRCMEPALPEDRCELLLLLAEQIPAR